MYVYITYTHKSTHICTHNIYRIAMGGILQMMNSIYFDFKKLVSIYTYGLITLVWKKYTQSIFSF